MRIGYFRIGVLRPDWDRLLKTFENVPTPNKMVVDGALAEVDGRELRVGMYTDHWNRMVKTFEKSV